MIGSSLQCALAMMNDALKRFAMGLLVDFLILALSAFSLIASCFMIL